MIIITEHNYNEIFLNFKFKKMNTTLITTMTQTTTEPPELTGIPFDPSLVVLMCLCFGPFFLYTYAMCVRCFCPLERIKTKPKEVVIEVNRTPDELSSLTSSIKEINKKNKDCMIKSDCTICLEKINFGRFKKDKFISLECSHVFHFGCLQGWVSSEMEKGRSAKCPICRGELKELRNTVFVENTYYTRI